MDDADDDVDWENGEGSTCTAATKVVLLCIGECGITHGAIASRFVMQRRKDLKSSLCDPYPINECRP
jgi:hypothetical protein